MNFLRKISLVLALSVSATAFASSTRILTVDQFMSSDLTQTYTLPAVGGALVSATGTATLTNKTIDGASNTFTNIPTSAFGSGTVGVANGGTGLATLTLGSLYLGNGTSAPTAVAPGTTGNVLTSNGTTWQSTAPATQAPSVTGSTGSPTAITAAGGVTFTGSNYSNVAFITGSGGPVTVTASPQIAAGTLVGQKLTLVGESATNTVKLQDGTGLSLNGAWVGGLQSQIHLLWDGAVWSESSRR